MKASDVINAAKRKIKTPRAAYLKTVLAVSAGAASAIWVALRLRRDLYGPGGTKLSRYDRSVDKRWPRGRD